MPRGGWYISVFAILLPTKIVVMKHVFFSDVSVHTGKKMASLLAKEFGISRVIDLLTYYPRRYICRGKLTKLSELIPGDEVTIVGRVLSTEQRKTFSGANFLSVTLSDGENIIQLVFFHQPWRAENLKPGACGLFSGKVTEFNNKKQLSHPEYELFSSEPTREQIQKWNEQIIPIYRACIACPSWKIARAVDLALEAVKGQTVDFMSGNYGYMSVEKAFYVIHHPTDNEELEAAKESLRFFEAFLLQSALLHRKRFRNRASATPFIRKNGGFLERFDARLEFSQTNDQLRAADEIFEDLSLSEPMTRLLHGEVGSGKTLVAIRAMLLAADNDMQAVLVAPTEVLAKQHHRNLTRMLGHELCAEIQPSLLLGREKHTLRIASGRSKIIIGTHSVFSKKTVFHNLALVVIDEQHRFGVGQRDELLLKGDSPHLLMLSATPIPRTVALSLLNFIAISEIKTPPSGKAEISTHVVPLAEKPQWGREVIRRISEEIQKGHQVFVVAPVIEQSRTGAASISALLRELEETPLLQGAKISRLHGKLTAAECEKSMEEFSCGASDILLSTTMIEVGIDVPNATAMVIVSADRFGIAQLHQLRGRIGRGNLPGVCLLVTNAPEGSAARSRLDLVARTHDGFSLAEIDMKMRREGDLLGLGQSGQGNYRLLRLDEDLQVLSDARLHAEGIMENDIKLEKNKLLRLFLSQYLSGTNLSRLLS